MSLGPRTCWVVVQALNCGGTAKAYSAQTGGSQLEGSDPNWSRSRRLSVGYPHATEPRSAGSRSVPGRSIPGPSPIEAAGERTLLATQAKGIYKPGWSDYALSVRQTLGSPYPDRDPEIRTDGTWSYAYFQENPNPAERDREFTNRGLVACLRDGVPVGAMSKSLATRTHGIAFSVSL